MFRFYIRASLVPIVEEVFDLELEDEVLAPLGYSVMFDYIPDTEFP